MREGPIASTPYGQVEGFVHTTESNKDVNVFLGIRYAESKRFERNVQKPQIVEKWNGILPAKKFKSACFPFHRETTTKVPYSEDCLFVNISTPKNNKPETKYPVLVFIHGGGFQVGDTETYGYKSASEHFVSQDIIFVSISYRLGFLALFTTGNSCMPGNLCYWDVATALKFLHEILPSFGGDSDKITIAGHSAGSAIVSAMLFSPHSNKYFAQAIELSGSSFAEYSTSEYVVESCRALADALGCTATDSNSVKEFMKSRTIDEIWDGVDQIGPQREHILYLRFHPYYDKEFFPHTIEECIKTAPKKKTIQGVTSKEIGFFVCGDLKAKVKPDMLVPRAEWENYKKENLVEYIASRVANKNEFGNKRELFFEALLKFYANDDAIVGNMSKYLDKLIDLVGDLYFVMPSLHEIHLKNSQHWESYFYVIDHISGFKKDSQPATGAFHADEIPYMLEFMGLEKMPLSENDKKFQKSFLGSIIQFIKTGNPSTAAAPWLPVSSEKPLQHMRFNENSKMMDSFRPEAVHFWLETVPKLIGTDRLSKTRLPVSHVYENLKQKNMKNV